MRRSEGPVSCATLIFADSEQQGGWEDDLFRKISKERA